MTAINYAEDFFSYLRALPEAIKYDGEVCQQILFPTKDPEVFIRISPPCEFDEDLSLKIELYKPRTWESVPWGTQEPAEF